MQPIRRFVAALALAVPFSVAAAQLPPDALPPAGPGPQTASSAEQAGPAGHAPQRAQQQDALLRIARAQQPADDGFEPISELPPDERLPAAPMLVAAYVFVALALFLYLFSLARRLGAVKQEIARLEHDMKRSGRP